MRIVFFGSSDFSTPTFESLAHDGHEIVAAVTQPDRPRGRGKQPSPTPVKQLAQELGVPALTPEDVNASPVVAHLRSLKADMGYVAAFGQKIGAELLNAYPAGMINLHPSLLPALRGAAPIQWSILNGDEETGVTVFRLVEKMDAGPILVQRRTLIAPDETADELHDRLARIGCDALRAAIQLLEADPKTPGAPQDPSQATKARKLAKTDGWVAFDQPVRQVSRRIRGLWSWPGAACRFVSGDRSRDEIVILARAVPYEGTPRPAASPEDNGRITEAMSIQCQDAELALLEIKPANGRLMEWRDFVNGRHVQPGDQFLSIEHPGDAAAGPAP
jgi:methionyl-tRNA formyltransferase